MDEAAVVLEEVKEFRVRVDVKVVAHLDVPVLPNVILDRWLLHHHLRHRQALSALSHQIKIVLLNVGLPGLNEYRLFRRGAGDLRGLDFRLEVDSLELLAVIASSRLPHVRLVVRLVELLLEVLYPGRLGLEYLLVALLDFHLAGLIVFADLEVIRILRQLGDIHLLQLDVLAQVILDVDEQFLVNPGLRDFADVLGQNALHVLLRVRVLVFKVRAQNLDHFFDVLDALELDLVLLQLLDHALQPLVELLQLAVI